jgi:hypothetical protein
MTKQELQEEVYRLEKNVEDMEIQILRLKAQHVLMGIALEDFKTDEDQTITAILHGLIADYYKLKSDYHYYLREDINTNLADYR